MLYDVYTLMLDSEVENICIVFKLKASQVFQRYAQPIDCEDVIVGDSEYQPLKVSEVMRGYVCSCKTAVLVVAHQHIPYHSVRAHLLIYVNGLRLESSFHVLLLVLFRRSPILRRITTYY